MSRADKAISRAQNVIWKEIGRISDRIEGLKEKYPPDMFGGKWEEKAFDLDADRDKLKRYLSRMKQAEQEEFDRITAEDKLAHMYVKLQAYRNALAEVDPFALQKLDRRFGK